MDCSPDSSLVVSKPHPQDPSRKIITILTKQRKVEVIPDPTKLEVKVDGTPISMPTHPDIVTLHKDSRRPVVLKKIRDDKIEVKLPHVGLSVVSDGKKVSVKVPQTYWSKLCGVCSSLDSRPEDLNGPQKVRYSDPQQVASAYLIPDSQCDPLPVQKSLGVPEIREKSKHVQPIEKTLTKQRKINGILRTCFSTSPVKKCPTLSIPKGVEDHLVSFYCLRSLSSKADRYLEITKSRILDEVRDKRPDMNENIPMPTHCIKQ
ncbi:vitellogenin-like [Mercenaria mercenaria]|uniref:vitellogenin-like n=1 Tax=Mercenaria mercenaria TaxID=6596 RepID=UPI00234EE730|nr:vitellogenin-like [Mercenaria mercenaria]